MRVLSKEHKEKLKIALKGKNKGRILPPCSKEHREKLKEKQIGKNNSFYGKKHTEITKQKIREKAKGRKFSKKTRKKLREATKKNTKRYWLGKTGKNSSGWRGGISFDPYPINWTETLRRSIRERDRYTCRVCNKQQGDIAFDVHHIDYNKNNCDPYNLILLCRSCHSKTNGSRRYWIKYFNKLTN